MGRHDWYRNAEWNDAIEAEFRAKLSRARSGRPQYLQIQAGELADRYPTVSLVLIEEYFQTSDDFVVPSALCVRAKAFCALGQINHAVTAYKQALEWEDTHPNFITSARMELPVLIVSRRLVDQYYMALEVLTTRFDASDHQFPSARYRWNGCCALIAHERGDHVAAIEFAERALRAAAETESPFRYHRSVGVVKNADDDFGRRVKRIARPSKLRSLFRVIRRS